MKDWIIRGKENLKEYRNGTYKEQPLPLGLR